MNELALFAGAGGGILASKLLGFRTVCAVEIEPYCREILLRRQEEKILPAFPIWDDVRTFDGNPWCGKVDIVTAGFPCQPFSVGGDMEGEHDNRNMWPDTRRIIGEVRPQEIFLENVAHIIRFDYFGKIIGDLVELGFGFKWGVVSAKGLGAPFTRKRFWLFGSKSSSLRCQRKRTKTRGAWRKQQFERLVQDTLQSELSTSTSCGISDGVSCRLDRLKALGNGQVPAVAATAFELLGGQ